ncbi:response regulator [Methylobacterium brachythecii]|uniref:DNA-binding response OmpR family regulator n=1 Tax=Methylobacterium brachythecii TaxID=1176177 RepID=A0A7W6ALC5_9HYPH|nr:response regulator transcription factor [Methylobacterium brachythecii]MBB3903314.1 DNA-binding response OmpR family regulator [Methylobacterium brachythecii]GLS46836.1 DNA-binding response regulator [Methylobacterium brachythecii]
MRILVVDDNAACASCFGETLREAGFVVDVSANLAEADDSVSVATYDAILVDRMLPDGDGLDWIRSQRRGGGTVPMLIVSAERDEVDHRIEGLNAGADDYMVKPVPLDELVARVRAVLRRPPAILNPVLQAGNVEFDPSNREVLVDGKALRMPRRETCIFEMLIRRVGKTVTKSLLEEGLYSFEDEVSANAIEVGIYRLRGHLMGSSATVSVRTVRGTGYVLEPHDVPIVAPQVPQAALIAAQVAVALVNDGSSNAPALPAIAASLSTMQAHETNVAVVAAALAVSMAVGTDDDGA